MGEKRPQEKMLESLKNGLDIKGLDIDLEKQSITFNLHKGGRIQDVGLKGCTLADMLQVCGEAQRFYDLMFPKSVPPSRNQTIYGWIETATNRRRRFERDAVLKDGYDNQEKK